MQYLGETETYCSASRGYAGGCLPRIADEFKRGFPITKMHVVPQPPPGQVVVPPAQPPWTGCHVNPSLGYRSGLWENAINEKGARGYQLMGLGLVGAHNSIQFNIVATRWSSWLGFSSAGSIPAG